MGQLSKNNVYKIAINAVADGNMIENVLWYRMIPKVGAADCTSTTADLLNALVDKWRSEVLTKLTTSYSVLRYRLSELTGRVLPLVPQEKTGWRGRITYGTFKDIEGDVILDVGTMSAVDNKEYPCNVTLPIQKFTEKQGRKNRGLLQISPIPKSYGDFDRVSTSGHSAGDLIGLAVDTLSTIGAAPDTPEHVIFNLTDFVGNKAKPGVAGSNLPKDYCVDIESMTTKNFLGTQQHRKSTKPFGV